MAGSEEAVILGFCLFILFIIIFQVEQFMILNLFYNFDIEFLIDCLVSGCIICLEYKKNTWLEDTEELKTCCSSVKRWWADEDTEVDTNEYKTKSEKEVKNRGWGPEDWPTGDKAVFK